jgi:hypothetical protein
LHRAIPGDLRRKISCQAFLRSSSAVPQGLPFATSRRGPGRRIYGQDHAESVNATDPTWVGFAYLALVIDVFAFATVPGTISFPNRASLLASLSTEYAGSLAEIPDTPAKTAGIAAGTPLPTR